MPYPQHVSSSAPQAASAATWSRMLIARDSRYAPSSATRAAQRTASAHRHRARHRRSHRPWEAWPPPVQGVDSIVLTHGGGSDPERVSYGGIDAVLQALDDARPRIVLMSSIKVTRDDNGSYRGPAGLETTRRAQGIFASRRTRNSAPTGTLRRYCVA